MNQVRVFHNLDEELRRAGINPDYGNKEYYAVVVGNHSLLITIGKKAESPEALKEFTIAVNALLEIAERERMWQNKVLSLIARIGIGRLFRLAPQAGSTAGASKCPKGGKHKWQFFLTTTQEYKATGRRWRDLCNKCMRERGIEE